VFLNEVSKIDMRSGALVENRAVERSR